MGTNNIISRVVRRTIPSSLKDDFRHFKNYYSFHFHGKKPGNPHFSFSPLHYHHCIFFHVPRTGGIAIANALFQHPGAGHFTVNRAKREFGYRYDQFFKFSFVRHPYSKLSSSFYYLKNGGYHENDAQWSADHLAEILDFRTFIMEWLSEEKFEERYHFRPQVFFLEDEEGRLAPNFIGRFENLEKDYQYVQKRIGLGGLLIKKNQSESPKNPMAHYDLEMKKKIQKIYRADFLRFGYDI